MSTPEPDSLNPAAPPSAQQRIAAAQARLTSTGWLVGSAPVATLTRDWPDGTVDTVIVLSPETAYARRDVAGVGMVVSDRGTVEAVVEVVQLWPTPGTPGEPLNPLQDRPKDFC